MIEMDPGYNISGSRIRQAFGLRKSVSPVDGKIMRGN